MNSAVLTNTFTGLRIAGTSLTVLDTYVSEYNFVTMMLADSSQSDRANCKIVQFDFATKSYRERSVPIFTDGALQQIKTGILTDVNSGAFGARVYTIGYQNLKATNCEADTVKFKYPQFYNDQTSSSSKQLAIIQSITASESCIQYDDSFGNWQSTLSWNLGYLDPSVISNLYAFYNERWEYIYMLDTTTYAYKQDYSAYQTKD